MVAWLLVDRVWGRSAGNWGNTIGLLRSAMPVAQPCEKGEKEKVERSLLLDSIGEDTALLLLGHAFPLSLNVAIYGPYMAIYICAYGHIEENKSAASSLNLVLLLLTFSH